jgi:Spy/CpxP family protein refolding chaperone
MLKSLIASCLLLFVTAFAPAASAQSEPSGKWWHDPGIKAELDLKDGEIKKLDRLFKNSRRRLIDLKTKVEKAQFEYQNLMEAEPLDEAAVNRQFAKLEKARSKLAAERSRFLVEVRKILGHSRFQRLKQIYRQR